MNKSLTQLFEEAKALKLSEREKLGMMQDLRVYLHHNLGHVRNGAHARLHLGRSMLETLKIKLTFTKPMPVFIAILIALMGGTSFAAQSSLPGSPLYPVKVHVNEEVRSLLTFSAESKAELDADLANERLDEAEKLAVEGKLTADARAQLEQNFQEHANRVQSRVKSFMDTDAQAAADISSNFETSLNAHERILTNVGLTKDSTPDPEVKKLLVKVEAEDADSAKDVVNAEAKVAHSSNVQAAAEGRLHAAQNKVAEVQKFIAKAGLDATATAQAQARLKIASDKIAQGQAQLSAKAYAQAFTLFGQAHSIAQEAKLLIEAKDEFDGDTTDTDVEMNDDATGHVSPSPSIHGSTQVETDGSRSSGHGDINLGL